MILTRLVSSALIQTNSFLMWDPAINLPPISIPLPQIENHLLIQKAYVPFNQTPLYIEIQNCKTVPNPTSHKISYIEKKDEIKWFTKFNVKSNCSLNIYFLKKLVVWYSWHVASTINIYTKTCKYYRVTRVLKCGGVGKKNELENSTCM